MSDGTGHGSMDDVLASIRRIVGPGAAPDAEAARRDSGADGDEAPLVLTPGMRIDDKVENGDGGEVQGAVEPEATARPAGAAATAAMPAIPEREALRALVREILAEEIAGDAAGDLVRGIVRDELINGETGDNATRNVRTLIEAEIAKALAGR